MKIVVTWSNGMKSEVEVEVPAGATPLRTNFNAKRPDTALRQREDSRWECLSVKSGGGLLGYCLPDQMVKLMASGHPVEGLSWAELRADQSLSAALAYAPENNELTWQGGYLRRRENREKFHFHGHSTEQEAINCYQQFLQDFGEKEPI